MSDPHEAPLLAPENAARGTACALLVVPFGVIAWVVLWRLGILAPLLPVAFGIASYFLYRRGAGGVVGPRGTPVMTAVTIVTTILGLAAGYLIDTLSSLSASSDVTIVEALVSPELATAYTDHLLARIPLVILAIALTLSMLLLACYQIPLLPARLAAAEAQRKGN